MLLLLLLLLLLLRLPRVPVIARALGVRLHCVWGCGCSLQADGLLWRGAFGPACLLLAHRAEPLLPDAWFCIVRETSGVKWSQKVCNLLDIFIV